MNAFLEWRGVGRAYEKAWAVRDFSLQAEEGEVLALLGPSGSGKSTLLRLTAGLEEPSAGTVLMDGRDIAGTPVHARRFGLMFQEYCLFPHLDVRRNVDFGLRMLHEDPAARSRRVEEMLSLVRMEGMGSRDVGSLSGGEQQRVALARSLAPSPRLLMLDEPLGALDSALRQSLLGELAQIIARVGVTTLYVTHDQAEAMTIATRIALVRGGTLVQAGTPAQLMSDPADAFVAGFLGLGTLVPGTWNGTGNERTLVSGLGTFAAREVCMPRPSVRDAARAVLLVPSDALRRTPADEPGKPGTGLREVRCRIDSRIPRPTGAILKITLHARPGSGFPAAGFPAELQLSNGRDDPADSWQAGEQRALWLDAGRCRVLAE